MFRTGGPRYPSYKSLMNYSKKIISMENKNFLFALETSITGAILTVLVYYGFRMSDEGTIIMSKIEKMD